MVTTNYKGVIIISIKTKATAIILAVIFAFAGAIYAFANEPNIYSRSITGTSVSKTNFNAVQPIETSLGINSFELTAENITDSGVTLSWSSDKLYISYKVCKFNVFTDLWEEYALTNKNSIRINNLSSDTSYRFCILNGATNEVLAAKEVKTAVGRPKLKIKDKTSSSITLSIGKHGENETVIIYRSTGKGEFEKIAQLNGKSTFTDSGLKGNQSYAYKARAIVSKGGESFESDYSDTLETKTMLSMGLPAVSGTTKTYAYYTAVTARRSPQYRLLNSDKCTTDPETGIRMYEGCYCVALGSFYGTKIGSKYKITFSSGKSIKVVLCDQKANRHTDSNHQYAVNNRDIVEFYVQRNMIPKGIRGDYGRLSGFSGSVVSIEKYMD